MQSSSIRHLATSPRGNYFAAAEFKSITSIWNIDNAEKLCEFPTVLDFGGSRLAITSDGTACIAGAYHVNGIVCYALPSGNVLWQRKDLKKVQRIRILPSDSAVACGIQDRPLHILSMETGKTLQKLRDCKHLKISEFEQVQFADKTNPELQTLDGSRIAQVKRKSFAILSVAFGHNLLAISEAGGPVRWFDTKSGACIGEYARRDNHILDLGYSCDRKSFLGVEWAYDSGGEKKLVLFDPAREHAETVEAFRSTVEAFCLAGDGLLSSSGWLMDTASGALVKQFPFSTRE